MPPVKHSKLDRSCLKGFAAIILTHGRPENCPTFSSLRKHGYTGKIIVLIDNEDKTADGYRKEFGADNVVVFDKKSVSARYRNMDNFQNRRAVVYARNAAFEVAKAQGYRYFIQLDDDYVSFRYRVNANGGYDDASTYIHDLDGVFAAMMEFMRTTNTLSIAMSQGGDHLGGPRNTYFKNGWCLRRKIMNSWLCDTTKPFTFEGRMNEDVTAYLRLGYTGSLFFTFMQAMLTQVATQQAAGGMTEVYTANGTYVKSFYSVMARPSAVKIGEIGVAHKRIHHCIDWNRACPKLLRESVRKQ